jgi:hypothetical protein
LFIQRADGSKEKAEREGQHTTTPEKCLTLRSVDAAERREKRGKKTNKTKQK